jgi:tetratricopeptide (TPR) repeat protein
MQADAIKALSLDPDLGDARGLLASSTYFHDWNWPEAERQFRLALAEGAQAPTEQRFGSALITRGRFAEGMTHLETAIELDPLGKAPRVNWLIALYFQRKYAEVYREADSLLASEPNFIAARVMKLSAALVERDCTTTAAQAAAIGQHYASAMANIEYAMDGACRGDRAAVQKSVAGIESSKTTSFASPFQLALVYAVLGDKTTALQYLDKSADLHEPQILHLKVEPLFDSFRTDPGFIALEKRVHLVE